MSAEELKKFYKARVKKPDLFTYDDDGNLVELNKDGGIVKTIPLPDYRPPSYEEFDEMEQKRLEAIAVANKEFEDARRELNTALQNPETPDSEVLRINRKVKEADIKLQAIRFPLRYVDIEEGIPINQIEFDKSYEKRKFPYPFFFLKERPFQLQEQYVRVGKAPIQPQKTVAELKAAAEVASVPVVILFQDPETNDYGFLSLNWTVEIEFNGTMYNSAKQAIAAELAKAFNDQANLQKIMIAESPEEVNYNLDDVPGDTEANETKWNENMKQLLYDVNIAKFNQYPELTARLLETKTAVLGAYIPDDNLIGIGISLDNVQSKNPINWTGQNLLGKALTNIRDKIRSDRDLEAAAAQQAAMAAPQPVPRRKKPSVAPASIAQIPSDESAILGVPAQVADETGTALSLSRGIRRRPQPSLAPSGVPVGEEAIAEEAVTEE
jgi:ribA/ribD-fused uncharacterized protein